MRNLTLKNKYLIPSFPNSVKGRQASVGKGNFSLMIEASLKTDYKQQTDNDWKRAEIKQQEYNDIDWPDLCHRNQLSSLREGELELYINHYNIAFKKKKDQKFRVVKAHIGSKILTVRTTFNQLLAHMQRLTVTVTG